MGDFVTFPEGFSEDFIPYKRPKFVSFLEGSPRIVRILDENAYGIMRHWIRIGKPFPIMCLGDECPICKKNAEIRAQYPDDFGDVKGYLPRQYRWMVNVLDRTPVVKDPETGEEYYGVVSGKAVTFPTVTSDGLRSLVDQQPAPSNTIKVLERGKRLFELIKTFHLESLAIDDDTGEESGGINTFDIKLVTLGKKQSMTISVVPLYQNVDDITPILDEFELEKYVLSSIGVQLSPEEMVRATEGVSLADIFAARRAQEEAEISSELQEALSDTAGELVQDLFTHEGSAE